MSSLFDSVYIAQELTNTVTSLDRNEFTSIILLIKHFRDLYMCDPEPFSFIFGFQNEITDNYFLMNHSDYTIGFKSKIPQIKFTKDPNCIDEDIYYFNKKGDNFISGYLLAIWLAKSWISDILPKEYHDIIQVEDPSDLISDQFPSFEEFYNIISNKLQPVHKIYPKYPTIQKYPKENLLFDMINPKDINLMINTLPEPYMLSDKDIDLIKELTGLVSQMIKYILQQKYDTNKELFDVFFKLRYNFAIMYEYFSLKDKNQAGGLRQIKSLKIKEPIIDLIDKIILNRGRDIQDDEYSKYKNQVAILVNSNMNDLEIFKELRGIYSKIPSNDNFNRAKQRVRELQSINFFDTVKSINTVLDFGGQTGIFGKEISNILGASSVTVSDIANWFGNTYTGVSGVNQVFLNTYSLNFDTESFDLILCFQVLHHIKKWDTTLKELYRICKKGGYLLIREHDCNSEEMRVIIDLEHSLYECSIQDAGYQYLQNYYANYFTQNQLNSEIVKAGFIKQSVNSNPNDQNLGKQTRYYYQLYKK